VPLPISGRRVMWPTSPKHCVTGGRDVGLCVVGLTSGLFRHRGWPNPLALLPVPPLGLGVMSKMILSGWVVSPAKMGARPLIGAPAGQLAPAILPKASRKAKRDLDSRPIAGAIPSSDSSMNSKILPCECPALRQTAGNSPAAPQLVTITGRSRDFRQFSFAPTRKQVAPAPRQARAWPRQKNIIVSTTCPGTNGEEG